MNILLLEDDPLLNEIIEEFLVDLHYTVDSFYDGQEALEAIYEQQYALLVLDVNVPSLNGFDLCKTLKQHSIDIPTIFITSQHTPQDVQNGFKAGADDYIKKPFDLSELALRINNIKRLRKIESFGKIVVASNVTYHYDSKTITRDEKEYVLSKIESKVFEYFLKNRNRVLSIDEISLNNWAYDDMPIATTIRTYIKNIRKIVGKDKITTIKGIGYKLNT